MSRLLRASLILAVLSALALTPLHAEALLPAAPASPAAPAEVLVLDPNAASAAAALLGVALLFLSDWRRGPPEPESIVCRSYFRKRSAERGGGSSLRYSR